MCVCTKDYNLEQKVLGLNKIASLKSLPGIRTDLRSFQCHPNRSCVDRNCPSCRVGPIKEFYKPLAYKCKDSDKVKYHRWETVPETYTDKLDKHRKQEGGCKLKSQLQ